MNGVKEKYKCSKCGYAWNPKKKTNPPKPKCCPKCKQYDWDK